MDRLKAIVVDAKTGEPLDGVASELLCVYAERGAMLARLYEGEWLYVDGSTRDLSFYAKRGWEIREVRVVEQTADRDAELDADDLAALAELRSMLTVVS